MRDSYTSRKRIEYDDPITFRPKKGAHEQLRRLGLSGWRKAYWFRKVFEFAIHEQLKGRDWLSDEEAGEESNPPDDKK